MHIVDEKVSSDLLVASTRAIYVRYIIFGEMHSNVNVLHPSLLNFTGGTPVTRTIYITYFVDPNPYVSLKENMLLVL